MVAASRKTSVDREYALQVQLQSLLASLRTLYFGEVMLAQDMIARRERQLLDDLQLVGERLKATNPDNWSP